ncbi:septum formation family protein [Streptomyces sp. NPDC089919]|uniref:septum formation family protein n=1 Tax=Streptomyces sp. NPDC089919 TaxID=3155188 RepID=UPI00342AF52D
MSALPRTPHVRAGHGAALVLALVLGAAGAGQALGAPASEGTNDLKVGDCFNSSADLDDYEHESAQAPTSVDVVPCANAHQSETFAVFTLPEGAYPGEKKVIAMAGEKCSGDALADYVGPDAKLPDSMSAYYYYPRSGNWALGDRQITCFLGDSAGPTTGSVRATAT